MRVRRSVLLNGLAVSLCAVALMGCGGGSGSSGSGGRAAPVSAAQASRFLTQATFGPTDSDIAAVQSSGISGWIDSQITAPQASSVTFMTNQLVAMKATNPNASVGSYQFFDSFWQQAATAPDPLRERVKLALSEQFVVSFQFSTVDAMGMGSYWDMLGTNAFGNFRTLLEGVTLHPQMGRYLTYLGNQKENLATGQHPDENYAREVMQLMTIGLWQLNQDGTQKLDSAGHPIPTYTHDDIAGLAKVFTGLSFYSPAPTNSTFYGGNKDTNAETKPMIYYPAFHSVSEKDFLGVVIPASTTPDPAGDVKIALDTLFNHPNTAPFVSKSLIQRLVTSNPSPAYVSRVAGVFINNGKGVRGDMAAVVKAVLTDPEARDDTVSASATFGKLREPVVRMANWMRAFGAASTSGTWGVGDTSAATSLAQAPLDAPSVFNFWRPGYVSSNSKLGAAGLVGPEFQVVDEVSVAGYVNTLSSAVSYGIGYAPGVSGADIKTAYPKEVALAATPQALVDRLNTLLFYGQMSSGLQQTIVNAVNSVSIPGGSATAAQITAAQTQRVQLAVLMAMSSGEYLAQR